MSKESTRAEPSPATILREPTATAPTRRHFLQLAGVTLSIAAIGCDNDDNTTGPGNGAVDLGAGDTGILNYAYALEQLEASFYTQVIASPYSGITAEETAILRDIRDHEIVHREFFKAALGTAAIGTLMFTFSAVNFGSRASVLGTAKVFEDLGVGAYNGAGQLLTDGNLLLIAGKIVSVEARHASTIRDLLNPNSSDFAGDDIVAVSTGLDSAQSPSAVLGAAGSFVIGSINFSSLPTS